MADALTAWWAQQLLLCDWAMTTHPLAVDSASAEKRLEVLGISHRGELVDKFLHGLGASSANPHHLLSALEWSALAGAAGWISPAQASSWAHHVMRRIAAEYRDLRGWLRDLRLALGSAPQDVQERFQDACQQLAQAERESHGVSWEQFTQTLSNCSAPEPLWPDTPSARPWRLGALLHPVMCYPATPADWRDAGSWLAKVWQVHDRSELLGVVLWLSAQGDRQRWDIEARELQGMDHAQRKEWQRGADDEFAYAAVLIGFVDQGETFDWAAWDWLRMIELAWAGACCGLLSQEEADDIAAHGADLVSQRYADWTALLSAFRRGQSLFEGVDRRAMTPNDHQVLLLKASCTPWNIAPNVLLEPEVKSASRARFKDWRATGHHWLLALASVREPDAMLRQLDPGAFMGEKRRADAALYLQDALALHADEGAEALERYWLPAQAHHLNQLAADAVHGVMPPTSTPFGRPHADEIRKLQSLKGVSRHAATIHMAEKFAFYLYMAFDSQLFDDRALIRYADALKSCLCRFYPSPRHLLEAWFAWEGCLPEPEHDSLLGEIAWHLEDPGSLFHWLDWRPGSWQEPGERPSLNHFTAMALVGPLNSAVWSEPQPESERERASIREWVDSHYHLASAADMQEFLTFMLEAGDRQEYQINYAPYTLNPERLESEIAILESGECVEEERHHLLRLRRVRDNEDGCNDVDMAAWDIAQLMDLAIAGRQLDWLDRSAFTRIQDRAYQLADAHYAGWQEYAAGMYAGFSFFMGETAERAEFLAGFRQALTGWLSGAPILAGPWTSLDFPGTRPRHFAPLHIDTLPGDQRILH
ncbi:YbeU/YbeR family protein [Halomonas sp. HNIBRBA4712]|uniref:DUF1266 domain-containing protein n=1 Tax=Halomonas sp. HNIBRBA4712 TaxID=3373087 RepID=UPI00374706EE